MPAQLDMQIAATICGMSHPELLTAATVYGLAEFRWVRKYLGGGEIVIHPGAAYRDGRRFEVEVDLAGQVFMPEDCADTLATALCEALTTSRLAA